MADGGAPAAGGAPGGGDAAVWRALAGNPLRLLASPWPWRCLAYLVSGAVVAAGITVALAATVLFPPAAVLLGVPVAALERWRLRLLDGRPAASPHTAPPPGPGAWLRCRLTEPATWRAFGYTLAMASVLQAVDLVGAFALFLAGLLLAAPALVPGGSLLQLGGVVVDSPRESWLVSLGIGLPGVLVVGYALCVLAAARASFARWLLTPTGAELHRQVDELARSRIRLVDAFEAERRRIERDLHDGAQQHLVLLTMQLGLAELELSRAAPAADPAREAASDLVAEAHLGARRALAAIRELVHGIHPQVLTDLGLAAAVGELAERCPVPVEVDVVLAGRPPRAVESTAYFVVAEALTNVVKHAGAHRATVTGRVRGGYLVVVVTDDGAGGADPSRGGGLRGLLDRASAAGGILDVTSPPGGPTTLRLELPCRCE